MLSPRSPPSCAAGYVYIGMDHFALPDDSLAVAKRQGRLHRNFQGYSTQADCDLIAGRVGDRPGRRHLQPERVELFKSYFAAEMEQMRMAGRSRAW